MVCGGQWPGISLQAATKSELPVTTRRWRLGAPKAAQRLDFLTRLTWYAPRAVTHPSYLPPRYRPRPEAHDAAIARRGRAVAARAAQPLCAQRPHARRRPGGADRCLDRRIRLDQSDPGRCG